MKATKRMWSKFEGEIDEPMDDEEILAMLREVREGLNYLRNRADRYRLAYTDAVMTEMRLVSYARARGRKVKE